MLRELLRAARGPIARSLQHIRARGESIRDLLDPPGGPWTVERSYQFCDRFAREHRESFPVASPLVPGELRPHLIALYAFTRGADDLADQPRFEGQRDAALGRWEQELHRCFHGEASHPIFVALLDTIERRELPLPPFEDLLTGFRMDTEARRYSTYAALRDYTAKSAEPVGRIMLALFGYRDPALVRFADEISAALQLTNFWQDLASDLARGRMYIPTEDLCFFDLTEADLRTLRPTRATRDLLRFEVARTRSLYEHGRPLLSMLRHDFRPELTLIWLVGTHILDKIEQLDFDVLTQRPTVRRRDKARITARAAKLWATSLDLGALRRLWP